jgi:16S rRNA processing protein RimM
VPIGRVLQAHGVAGEVLVAPYLHDRRYYARLEQVTVRPQEGSLQRYHVRHVREAGERLLLSFEGILSREAARALVGVDLCAPREGLPPPADGEFYWFDLEGLPVYTLEGEYLGHVIEFFPTGSNEVLVVRDGERELLLPFIRDVIAAVDETRGCLRVRLIPGLL